MSVQYLDVTQTGEGWHSVFAFQVFHRPAEEWVKMRWGFNAAALLEEALDRCKLFLEAQAINESLYFDKEQPICSLALRGINFPGRGVQMALLGKVTTTSQQVEQAGSDYARKIFSVFPQDFILQPAKTQKEYYSLAGGELIARQPHVASIQRGSVLIPPMRPQQEIQGLWQASARSNEQIWRTLSNMPQAVMLNILIQPALLLKNEKERLLQIKLTLLDAEKKSDELLHYHSWLEEHIKRRLAPWKKFFLIQVHALFESAEDNNFLQSIGSAITRDSNDLPLPGFEIIHPGSEVEKKEWLENIQSLTISHRREMDNIADLDEAFAVFRFPYQPEAGLPGANFIGPLGME
jgi:hypothetical protein